MVDLVIVQPNTRATAYPGMGDLPAVEPPLWARLIAGYCRDRGWRTSIIDAEALELDTVEVRARIEALTPKLAVVMATGHQPSASTQAMPAARSLCAELYGIVPTLLVGGHVAALPERTLHEEKCDYVCTGEGPVTVDALLTELCAHHPALASVPGLGWRGLGKGAPASAAAVFLNPNPPLVDVDKLTGNAWDLLPMERYRAHNWHAGDAPRQPYASIYTSLGCPYSCSFCCINAPFGKAGYRMRDPGIVVAEIAHLHDAYGVTNFKITDEMFVLNTKHVRAICTLLAALPYAGDLNIWAYARVDSAARLAEQLPLMRRAGIRWLALGIESADEAVRDGADKSFRSADTGSVVRQIQAAGIKVIGNFIFGLPGDTRRTMLETWRLAEAAGCDFANFYSAMAYPGSQLYRDADPAVLPNSWAGYAQHAYECHPLPTAELSSDDVLDFRDTVQEAYFRERAQPDLARRLPRLLLGDRAA